MCTKLPPVTSHVMISPLELSSHSLLEQLIFGIVGGSVGRTERIQSILNVLEK